MVLPIWALVSMRSSRTIAIKGAMPNQPKKHRKKANHVIWKARICGVFRLNRSIRVALFRMSTGLSPLSCGVADVVSVARFHPLIVSCGGDVIFFTSLTCQLGKSYAICANRMLGIARHHINFIV